LATVPDLALSRYGSQDAFRSILCPIIAPGQWQDVIADMCQFAMRITQPALAAILGEAKMTEFWEMESAELGGGS